jgi:hypothetical protein
MTRSLPSSTRTFVALAIAAGWVGAAASASAPPIIAVAAEPHFSNAPADVRITVRIAPSDANRQIAVILDGPGLCRSTTLDLRQPARVSMHIVRFHAVPAGVYVIRAAVLRAGRGGLHVAQTGIHLRE